MEETEVLQRFGPSSVELAMFEILSSSVQLVVKVRFTKCTIIPLLIAVFLEL